jgi:hypothetical protein
MVLNCDCWRGPLELGAEHAASITAMIMVTTAISCFIGAFPPNPENTEDDATVT